MSDEKAKIAKELEEGLPYFTGTQKYFRLYPNILLTEGAYFLAETAKCFWLMDIIFSVQSFDKVRKEPFQVYELAVQDDEGLVVCHDGNNNELYRQKIDSTDFPLPKQKLYFTDGVVMLPSEY